MIRLEEQRLEADVQLFFDQPSVPVFFSLCGIRPITKLSMQRSWIQSPQIRTNSAVGSSAMRAGRILAKLPSRGDNISDLFFYACVSVLAAIVVSVYPLRGASVPDVVDAAVVAINGEYLPSSSLLLPTPVSISSQVKSKEREVQFSKQVNYVLEIIGSSRKDPKEARNLAESIVKASNSANYDPLFVAAVVKAESTFDRHALSYAGARGLMQILPNTGKYISARNQIDWGGINGLSNPDYNLALGIAYLKELEGRFKGNREHALIAYNWGPANLAKAFRGEKTIPGSSVKYAKKILDHHKEWNKDYNKRAAEFKAAV